MSFAVNNVPVEFNNRNGGMKIFISSKVHYGNYKPNRQRALFFAFYLLYLSIILYSA